MTPKAHILRDLVILACVVFGLVFAGAVIAERNATARAKSAAAADQQTIRELQQDRDTRDKADKWQQSAAVTAQKDVRTSADAVRVITRYMPAPAPNAAPAVTVISRADLPAAEQGKIADAPSYAIETEDTALMTARNLLSCDADRASLTTCRADLKDADTQAAAAQDAAKHWETAAKGGTRWQRTKSALKAIGIGVAIGAATVAVLKK